MSLWHKTCQDLCVQLQGAVFLMTNSKHSCIQLWFGIPSWAARAMTLKKVCMIVTNSPILSWNMNKIHGVIRHRRHVTGLSSFLLLVFLLLRTCTWLQTKSICSYKRTQLFLSFSLSFSRGSLRLRSLLPDCLPLAGEAAPCTCYVEKIKLWTKQTSL